ncbi:MAG: hypothetical protein A3I24_02840 [Candidatus Harrisonbacteria bacterium RIFCSPLOWO2_02_FULL_41_13b]|uniref:Carrier domain-containing protein n=1 Tax=Candidatus Harrisonbacteria bacterium RIFCSPLOWO2_02_FULL_41_13b TaxID=1798409 RepID=A0A1G1ZRJ3_9BACT|nr:MAG: hypothetical protein A3J53_01870 [Candidatus Harrisonbacteria bacterium RIFCSPHIGHO2_02_FULL_40_20]OGY67091.1 MAG: hypothetical protein A3I24_02840 [Candidatus Harrisonbacteria bacterium RIFCSPLOWO2_02_FULL_41_13b]
MKKLEELLGKVLSIDSKIITDETSPANVESWDSFNGLVLVSELEKQFKVKFTIDEVTSVKNVGDIKKALKKHGIEL